VESVLSIESGNPSLAITIKLLPNSTQLKECLVYLEHLDEQRRDASLANKEHKKHLKSQYDKSVHIRVFSEGEIVFVYDRDKDSMGEDKFNPMWYNSYVVRQILEKGSYDLLDYEVNVLSEPKNRLFLRKYYA